jgi:hypothetical protein
MDADGRSPVAWTGEMKAAMILVASPAQAG